MRIQASHTPSLTLLTCLCGLPLTHRCADCAGVDDIPAPANRGSLPPDHTARIKRGIALNRLRREAEGINRVEPIQRKNERPDPE